VATPTARPDHRHGGVTAQRLPAQPAGGFKFFFTDQARRETTFEIFGARAADRERLTRLARKRSPPSDRFGWWSMPLRGHRRPPGWTRCSRRSSENSSAPTRSSHGPGADGTPVRIGSRAASTIFVSGSPSRRRPRTRRRHRPSSRACQRRGRWSSHRGGAGRSSAGRLYGSVTGSRSGPPMLWRSSGTRARSPGCPGSPTAGAAGGGREGHAAHRRSLRAPRADARPGARRRAQDGRLPQARDQPRAAPVLGAPARRRSRGDRV